MGWRRGEQDAAYRASAVSVSVPMTGTCANGHNVSANLSISVPAGAHGVHTCDASCGACSAPVSLVGTF